MKNDNETVIQNEEPFRLLFEYAPIGIAMRDNTGKLININEAYAKILGYTREELLAGAFEKVGYEDDIEKSELEYKKLLSGKDSTNLEKRLVKKDGSIIYVMQRLVMIRDDENRPLFLVGMTLDVTPQKLMMKAIKDNEEFYQSVLSNMSGIVYNCANDENYSMSYISDGIKTITGYPAEDFINNNVRSYADIIHPEDKYYIVKTVHDSLNNQKTYTMEYRLFHRDGSIVWVFEEGRAIYDLKGDFLHLNGTIINITARKIAEKELQLYKDHLEEMVKIRTEELAQKNRRLEEFNTLFVGREFRIKELRDQVADLKRKLREQNQ
jgi:PAS domain S-box-containing protein